MFRVEPFAPHPILWWHEHRDQVDMSPPYQRRGGLWSARDKAFLIDSIINGYDIPKLYVADFSSFDSRLNVHRLPLAVIDGRQRFEAIFDFLDGNIHLNDDFSLADAPDRKLSGYTYAQLLDEYPDISRRIHDFELAVVSVVTDDDARIRQLFVRLNRSKALTGAETRNAMEGVVPELIREVASHRFFESRISFSTKRGGDLNTAAKLILVEFRGQLVDTKKGPLDKFVQSAAQAQRELVTDALTAEAPLQDFRDAADRVKEVLSRMTVVFHERDPLLRTQGPVTLYYWLIRELDPELLDTVRPFLAEFDQHPRLQRTYVQHADPAYPVDQELLQYDIMNRSTNDQVSLEGRFTILAGRFQRHLGRGTPLPLDDATEAV